MFLTIHARIELHIYGQLTGEKQCQHPKFLRRTTPRTEALADLPSALRSVLDTHSWAIFSGVPMLDSRRCSNVNRDSFWCECRSCTACALFSTRTIDLLLNIYLGTDKQLQPAERVLYAKAVEALGGSFKQQLVLFLLLYTKTVTEKCSYYKYVAELTALRGSYYCWRSIKVHSRRPQKLAYGINVHWAACATLQQ